MTRPKVSYPKLPFGAKFVLIATLLPVYFNIAGLFLSPARLLFLVLVPYLVVQLLRGVYGKILLIDILVLLHVFWLIISVFINNPEVAVTYTGSNAIVILGGYLTARAYIRNLNDFVAFGRFLTFFCVVSLPFALYETVTSTMVIPRLIDALPKITSSIDTNYTTRLGLHRVQFIFAHPIHYGLFCSMAFSLCFIGMKSRYGAFTRFFLSACIALSTFLSVSSGPFLSLIVQGLLIAWSWIMQSVKKHWYVLVGLLGAIYVIAEILSTRPAIYAIVSKLSFSSHTANVRRILFDYGSAQIARTPILGVGFNPWPLPDYMTGSLDNHWLLLALVYGLPALLFLTAAIGVMFYRMGQNPLTGQLFLDTRRAWVFTMISLILTLSTVAIWGEMQSFFYFFIGAGVCLTTLRNDDETEPKTPLVTPPIRKSAPYSRFPHQEEPNSSSDGQVGPQRYTRGPNIDSGL